MPKVSAARKVQKALKYDVSTYAAPNRVMARIARRRLRARGKAGLRRQLKRDGQ
jgi:hypothetical protein